MQKPLLRRNIGLLATDDPIRTAYTTRSGVRFASAVVNLDVTDTGALKTRSGKVTVRDQAAHSISASGDEYLVFVSGGKLYAATDPAAPTEIRSVHPDLRMSYVHWDRRTYYTNGIEQGFISDFADQAWELANYVGDLVSEKITGPPLGKLLAFHNGKFFVAVDKEVYFSKPGAPNYFNTAQDFLAFESSIRAMVPVTGGMIISDEESMWFCSGNGYATHRKLHGSPAIFGAHTTRSLTASTTDAGVVFTEAGDEAAFVATTSGLLYISPGGEALNLTASRFKMPNVFEGAIGIIDRQLFLSTR